MTIPTILPPPMAKLTPGHDPRLIGIAVKSRVDKFGAHVVMVDAHGRVFARPVSDVKASLMESRFPKMIAGTFNAGATSKDIAEAIVFVYNEQLGVAA